MTHATLARDSLALFCVVQGAAAIAIDLNRTHATHPLWLGHARFHLVWQAASNAFLAVIEVALLLRPGASSDLRFYLAAILASVPLIGFLLALATMKRYRGTLSDLAGITPIHVTFLEKERHFDLNLIVVVLGLLILIGLVALYRNQVTSPVASIKYFLQYPG